MRTILRKRKKYTDSEGEAMRRKKTTLFIRTSMSEIKLREQKKGRIKSEQKALHKRRFTQKTKTRLFAQLSYEDVTT